MDSIDFIEKIGTISNDIINKNNNKLKLIQEFVSSFNNNFKNTTFKLHSSVYLNGDYFSVDITLYDVSKNLTNKQVANIIIYYKKDYSVKGYRCIVSDSFGTRINDDNSFYKYLIYILDNDIRTVIDSWRY